MADWRENLIEDDARIGALVKGASRVAVLGIKPESKADAKESKPDSKPESSKPTPASDRTSRKQ